MALPRLGSVGWLQVLPRLGVDPGTAALPAVTGCPACGGARLYTFQDTLFGGEWHACRDCPVRGDPVGLAAAVWKLDRGDAAAALGLDAAAAAEYLAAPAAAGAGAALRAAAGDARDAAARVGLVSGDWAARLGRFAVAVPRNAFRDALGAGVRTMARLPAGRGRERTDLLAVPFEDVPGRVVGAWATGREGAAATAGYVPGSVAGGRSVEGGLGFLGAVTGDPDPVFKDTVFVLADPLLALKVHDRHFRASAVPLPVAAWPAGSGRLATLDGGVLAGRRPVFWAPRVTPELIRQAKCGDGRVVGAAWEKPLEALDGLGPRAFLARLEADAVPWPAALLALLAGLPPAEAAAAFRAAALTAAEEARFVAAGGDAAAEAVRRAVEPGGALVRAVQVGQARLVEQGGCWYTALPNKPPELLTEAPFRVTQIIRLADRDETHYRVEAWYRGRAVTFVAEAGAFDGAPFARVRAEVARAGLGLPAYRALHGPQAVAVASDLRPPEFVTTSDRCGWNERRAAWVFPGFSVTARGDVGPGTVLPPDRYTPAVAAPPPGPPDPAAAAALSAPGPGPAVAWAVAGCVVANLVAPALLREPSGVLLAGDGAAEAGVEAALGLGCRRATATHNAGRAERVEQAAAAHGWPTVAVAGSGRGLGRRLRDRARNVVAATHPVAAAAAALAGGWHTVTLEARCRAPAALAPGLAGLAGGFLLWFARAGAKLPPGVPHGPAVFAALAEWFAAAGGRRAAVEAGAALVEFDGVRPAADRLRTLVRAADAAGLTRHQGWRVVRPAGRGKVLVSARDLAAVTAEYGGYPPAEAEVTDALAAAGALVDVPGAGAACPGWEVRTAWLAG